MIQKANCYRLLRQPPTLNDNISSMFCTITLAPKVSGKRLRSPTRSFIDSVYGIYHRYRPTNHFRSGWESRSHATLALTMLDTRRNNCILTRNAFKPYCRLQAIYNRFRDCEWMTVWKSNYGFQFHRIMQIVSSKLFNFSYVSTNPWISHGIIESTSWRTFSSLIFEKNLTLLIIQIYRVPKRNEYLMFSDLHISWSFIGVEIPPF